MLYLIVFRNKVRLTDSSELIWRHQISPADTTQVISANNKPLSSNLTVLDGTDTLNKIGAELVSF